MCQYLKKDRLNHARQDDHKHILEDIAHRQLQRSDPEVLRHMDVRAAPRNYEPDMSPALVALSVDPVPWHLVPGINVVASSDAIDWL